MYFWRAGAGHLQPCYQEEGGIHQESSFCELEQSAVAAVSPVGNVLSSIMITDSWICRPRGQYSSTRTAFPSKPLVLWRPGGLRAPKSTMSRCRDLQTPGMAKLQ